MYKVNKKVFEAIKGAMTEISAGFVLLPKTAEDRAWNSANERACSILSKYKEGKGLFQYRSAKDEKGEVKS